MSIHLKRQIERIADETRGERCSVIVQMETPKDDLSDFLEATSQALLQHRSAVSARAMVPPARDTLHIGATGKITPASKRKLQMSNSPTATVFLAGQTVRILSEKSKLKALGEEALRPLLRSDWVKEVVSGYAPASPSAPRPSEAAEPIYFWSSGSVVLDLSKDQLRELPDRVTRVADVFPNRFLKVPPVYKFKDQPLPGAVLDNKGYAWGLNRIGALSCWGAYDTRGEGVRVAVLDTGAELTHPDLEGKIAEFAEFDQNGNKIKDDPAAATDSDQHGTHCCGTIAGGRASGRWIGVAPKAQLLVGMVLKGGVGTDAQILAGMEWAISKRADLISMSLGGLRLTADVLDTYTRTIINANRLGIPVVVAVGNEGSQTSGSPGNDYFAFTVGATDASDQAAGFSGGRTQVIERSKYIRPEYLPVVYSKPDVTAPGVEVYSAIPGKKWEAWNGTSMATPHVAGAMALLLSKKGIAEIEGLDRVNLVQSLLMSTVRELGESGQNHRFGFGRIDVLRAFGYAEELGYLKEN